MRPRSFFVIALLLSLTGFFTWRLLGSHQLLAEYRSIKQKISDQQLKNKAQRMRNETVLAEVNRLKSNAKAMEKEARESLGMIKQDEVFYQITPEQEQHKKANS